MYPQRCLSLLSFIAFVLTARAASDVPAPASITPATADAPFALVSLATGQINGASPFFLVDGKEADLLPTPPARLEDLQVLRLWSGDAPLQNGEDPARDIPTLTVFLPPTGKAGGASMVICAGGAYSHISPREGIPTGQWLAKNGITAFILKYRIGQKYHYPAITDDASRAIRYVRAYAPAWGLDPNRIGIIGFSAGGHLASITATRFDAGDPKSSDPIERVSSRPDLQILLYPVVTLSDEDIVHKSSRDWFLGPDSTLELRQQESSDLQVTKDTPPAFVAQSITDPTVPIANSDHYTNALAKFNIPYVFIREPMGGHGFGVIDAWSNQAMAWLHAQKF